MKKIFNSNQSGFSLMEVMIAGAIAIGIALAMAKIGQNSSKSMTKMKTDAELENFKGFLKTNFSRGKNCTQTFAKMDWNMLDGGLWIDTVIKPPGIDSNPEYRSVLPAGGDLTEFEIVTNTDNTTGLATSSFTLVAGEPIPSYPNWTIEEIRIYNLGNNTGGDGDDNTGLCALYFDVKRIAGLNSTRSFGAGELNFWITLSCAVHPVTTAGPPAVVAKRMAYCVEDQAVVPGFWILEDKDDPTKGIRYGDDVYVGNHLIIESDQNIKRNEIVIDSPSEKLSKIDGLYYFLRHEEFPDKNYSKKRQIGFFAQQLEPIFPEMVMTNPQTNFKSVRYSMLIPVLVEAHKEQEQKLKSQKDQIRILNRKLDDLIRKVESIKK